DESRKYTITNGYGVPLLTMPVIHHVRFLSESLTQFDQFFMHKDNILQSSYKTETLTGLPVLYLCNTKKGLWKKFYEEFPNGMHRTAFMTRLENKKKLGTLSGISTWHEFTWPETGENADYFCTRSLSGFGPLHKFSPLQLKKIIKNHIFEKPNPSPTTHSQPTKIWTTHISVQEEKQSEEEENKGEIQQHDIPKMSTIANWITRTSRAVKHNMALEFLEKNNMSKVQS
ncbi:5792_t:CDS:2, partial [Cetraspora pellucida]